VAYTVDECGIVNFRLACDQAGMSNSDKQSNCAVYMYQLILNIWFIISAADLGKQDAQDAGLFICGDS